MEGARAGVRAARDNVIFAWLSDATAVFDDELAARVEAFEKALGQRLLRTRTRWFLDRPSRDGDS